MNSKRAAFVIALVLSLAALLGLAWAANVEDELKKLETDRAAAVVKGDVATLEKQTSDDYTLINAYGQMSGKSEMVDAFKSGKTKLTSDELSDMKVRVYGNTAVITGKATVKGTIGGKDVDGQVPVHPRLREDERRQLAIRRVSTNSCRQRITAETLRQPQLAPSLLFGIPRAGLAPSSARFA